MSAGGDERDVGCSRHARVVQLGRALVRLRREGVYGRSHKATNGSRVGAHDVQVAVRSGTRRCEWRAAACMVSHAEIQLDSLREHMTSALVQIISPCDTMHSALAPLAHVSVQMRCGIVSGPLRV